MGDICVFCGAPARAWCGQFSWCASDLCDEKFNRATYTPQFLLPPMDPTLWGRCGAFLAWLWFTAFARCFPVRWFVRAEYRGTWRSTAALWAHAGEYHWWFAWRLGA